MALNGTICADVTAVNHTQGVVLCFFDGDMVTLCNMQCRADRPVARIVKTRRQTGRAPLPSPPLSLEVGPLNPARGSGGAL